MKLIYIEWIDHVGIGNGWVKKQEALDTKPRIVKEVGWVLGETKEDITIAASLDLSDEKSEFVSDGIVVIKSCVKKKIDLTKYLS